MEVEFYPQYNISRRFRYTSETKGKTLSYLHCKESEFRLDNLGKYKNWQLNVFAINYDNTAKHEGVKLHYSKNIDNEDNKIVIKTKQIKFDFIEIEKIKKSKLKGERRENIRILAELRNPETEEKLEIISKIIRNKGPRIKDELVIYSIGRNPSTSTWEKLIITFNYSLHYYPEEMTLRINDRILNCSTKKDSSLQYHSYEFLIPKEILREKKELECILECLPFDKWVKFSNKFSDVETRKRKSYKSNSQDTPALTDLDNSSQSEEESVAKKPLLEEQIPDLYIAPNAGTLADISFKNPALEFGPRAEIGNNPGQSLCAEDILDILSNDNSKQSFSEKGFLDDLINQEDKDIVMCWDPDSPSNLKFDEILDILNSCRTE